MPHQLQHSVLANLQAADTLLKPGVRTDSRRGSEVGAILTNSQFFIKQKP